MEAPASNLDSAERAETYDVFISYSRRDVVLAKALKAALERYGLGVWLDLQSIAISTKWLAQIQHGIELRPIGESVPDLFFSAVAFINGGSILATARGDDVYFWDVVSGKSALPALHTETGMVRSLLALDAKRRLVTGGWNRPVAKVWQLDDAQPLGIASVTAHGKGGTMAVAVHPSRPEFITGGWDKTLRRWTLKNGQLQSKILTSDTAEGTQAIRFNRDGTRVVTADVTGQVNRWDLAGDVATRHPLGKHEGGANVMAAASRDSFVASGGEDGAIVFWNWNGGAAPYPAVREHKAGVTALAASADGARMASGDRDGRLLLWTLGNQAHFVELAPHARGVRSVTFTATGTRLVSAGNDGSTRLWDLTTTPSSAVELDRATSLSVATSLTPDGRMLALVADDNVTLIDLGERVQRIGVIPSPHGMTTVAAMTFSVDGKLLVTSSWGSSSNLKVWDVDPSSWATRACLRANRPMTPDELTLSGIDASALCAAEHPQRP